MNDAVKALRAWWRAPRWLVLSLVLDVLFFVVYGFVTSPIKDKILEHVVVIGSLMSQAAQESGSRAVQSGQSIVAMLLTRQEIAPYVRQVLVLFVMLAIAGFVTFVLFQAALWWVAHRRVGPTLPLPDFIARFASLTLWWGVLAAAYHLLSLLVDIRLAVVKTLSSTPASMVSTTVQCMPPWTIPYGCR